MHLGLDMPMLGLDMPMLGLAFEYVIDNEGSLSSGGRLIHLGKVELTSGKVD